MGRDYTDVTAPDRYSRRYPLATAATLVLVLSILLTAAGYASQLGGGEEAGVAAAPGAATLPVGSKVAV